MGHLTYWLDVYRSDGVTPFLFFFNDVSNIGFLFPLLMGGGVFCVLFLVPLLMRKSQLFTTGVDGVVVTGF